MNLFRNLLFWIVLALAGALLAQLLLAQDPGYVLVRWHGNDYTTTVLKGGALVFGMLFALWLLWTLLALPFRAWRRRRDQQQRACIGEGFDALHQGHYARAGKLLAKAAADPQVEAAARIGAAHAAQARGETAEAAAQLDALGERHPASRAIAVAECALIEDRPHDALAALDLPAAQPLPPRGLLLRAEALAATGRSADAYGMLGSLRQQQARPQQALDACERLWAEGMLRDAADANALADRWDALPKALRSDPGVVIAYAGRAAALHWDDAAAASLEQALDAQWDERVATCYGSLPVGGIDRRRARIERWLQAHPASPALALALARLTRAQGQWPQAGDLLHRAIAQGAGSEAWEELGHAHAAAGDDARARHCYANALRTARGEAPIPLHGDAPRADIDAAPAGEERDAHGIPRLRE